MHVDSIWFNYPNSVAIDLVDPKSNQSLGASPEWTRQGRNVPAAYVRNTSFIQLAVTLSGFGGSKKIRVRGPSGTLGERTVSAGKTEMFPAGSLSLRNTIAVNSVSLTWQVWVDDGKGGGSWDTLQSMTVVIFTTWGPMVEDPSQGLTKSVYYQLVAWTCTWAASLNDTKAICDAVIRNLAKSGLKYGVSAWEIREMLLRGGGMCAGWAKMYQYMVYCQGIFVYRRAYLVDWRPLANGDVQWAAIVCTAGGLNQSAPPVQPATFNDDNIKFPIPGKVALTTTTTSRWMFWGSPWGPYDGHVINFLTLGSKLYLYDPSFGTGPFDINMPLPPDDGTILGGTQLASFKSGYLNSAVPYMMGSLINGGTLYDASSSPLSTGITVKTSIIPDVVSGFDEITFYWCQG